MVGLMPRRASHAALTYAAAWAGRDRTHPIHVAVVYVDPMDGMSILDAIGNALHLRGITMPGDIPVQAAEVLVTAGQVPAGWTYLTPMGSVAEQLTATADDLGAEAVIVGRSRRGITALRTNVPRQLSANPRRTIIVVP